MQPAPDRHDPPAPPELDGSLSAAEVIDLTGESPESFQHALREALQGAGRPLEQLRGVWIDGEEVVRDDEGRSPRFRLRLRAAFDMA